MEGHGFESQLVPDFSGMFSSPQDINCSLPCVVVLGVFCKWLKIAKAYLLVLVLEVLNFKLVLRSMWSYITIMMTQIKQQNASKLV